MLETIKFPDSTLTPIPKTIEIITAALLKTAERGAGIDV